MATSWRLKQKVTKFKVLPFTNMSDHRPILCSIDMESEPLLLAESIERRFEDVPRRSKWNPSTSPTVFKLEATHNPVIAHEIRVAQDLECNNTDDVLKLNDIISNTYSEICKNIDTSPNAKDATTTKKRRRNKSRPKNVWFDRDCIDAKRELNQLARRYGKDPTNPELRTK